MPTERRRRGPLGCVLLVLVTCVALVAGLAVLFGRGVGPLPDPEGCQARVAGAVVDLSTEQAENASTISAVAVRRGLPGRAAAGGCRRGPRRSRSPPPSRRASCATSTTGTGTPSACSSSGRRRAGA